jgi:RNA polymerase sigma-70 factor, ECF subfamily
MHEMSQEIGSREIVDRESSWQHLLNRIANGDENALSEFYDQTKAPVYGLILRIVSLASVAEEVAMDVYLQVWRQASNYHESRGTLFGWLMLLARSRALDRLRRERRSRTYDWTDFAEGFDVVDSGHSPESLAQINLTKSRVTEVFRELPEEQRHVIELAFYEGMSHGEIAQQLQLPLGTVKSRIRSAIGRFRQVLA